MASFAEWQPQYAERRIATFPVRDKRPLVTGYLKVGLRGSRSLAAKYPREQAFGLACAPSGITVLDVDSPDENLFADALSEFGPSPFLVRSGSGNYQAWYRNKGERRRIRPDKDRPIDILGDGYVVVPPSTSASGPYRIIEGSLDDLTDLPAIRNRSTVGLKEGSATVDVGERNDAIWRALMKRAPTCSNFEELWQVAVYLNSELITEALCEEELYRTTSSAWSKEEAGENWFTRGERIVIKHSDIDTLMKVDPDAFLLLMMLRRRHWDGTFFIANAMCSSMPGGGWARKRFTAARHRLLVEWKCLQLVRKAGVARGPALYRFNDGQK